MLTYTAVLERRIGRWKEAEVNFKKALELDPRNVELLVDIGGDFYFYLRRYDDAKAMLCRALEISANSEISRGNLASLLQSQGDWRRAHRNSPAFRPVRPRNLWLLAG